MKTIVAVLLAFSFLQLEAQVSFVTETSSNQVSVGERIQIQFTLNNSQGRDFRPPTFKGFSVLSGPSTSQSTQWINGKTSSAISYVYLIQADAEGKFTIESAGITVDGKKLSSNPVTITVGKSKSMPKPSNDETALNQQAEDIVNKNLFLKLTVNKQQAYQGEPIVATYKLYVHPQLSVLQLGQPTMPSFTGFWAQDLGIKELKFTNETVNGITYRVAELKKVVLLPQQSGKLIVDPMAIESVVRLEVKSNKRQRSPFDDDFFDSFFNRNYRDFKFNIKSKSSDISIRTLPQGQPQDYLGAVGNLQLKSQIDKTKLKTGDAATLKVTVSGYGNLKLIDAPLLNLPPDFDVFDPKVTDNINVGESGMNGSKTFEYYIIPRNPGQYKIEPLRFSFFDLNTKTYQTLATEQYNIVVEQGSGMGSISGVSKEGIKYIGKDISFIKSEMTSTKDGTVSGSALFYILMVLPVGLFILLFIYIKKRDKEQGNQSLLKLRQARKLAGRRLKNAGRFIASNSENEFYEEISRVLWGYLSDKLTIPVSTLTKQTATDLLRSKQIQDNLIDEINSTIDYCEFVRFAPGTERKSMNAVFEKAVHIITELEGAIR